MSEHVSPRKNNQQTESSKNLDKTKNRREVFKSVFGDVKNVVTKFAFATRVGYIPNNPYKQN